MGWKKALFFGGAVLVLAACSDSATAPTALDQVKGSANWTLSPTTSTTTSTTIIKTDSSKTLCSGFVIRTGSESDSTSTCTGW